MLKLKDYFLFFSSSLLHHISNPKLPCRRRSRKCTPVCDQVRPSNQKKENFPSLIFQKKTCPIQYLKRKQSHYSKNKIARATFSIRSSPPARPPTSVRSTGDTELMYSGPMFNPLNTKIIRPPTYLCSEHRSAIVSNWQDCKHCYCQPTSAQSTGGETDSTATEVSHDYLPIFDRLLTQQL